MKVTQKQRMQSSSNATCIYGNKMNYIRHNSFTAKLTSPFLKSKTPKITLAPHSAFFSRQKPMNTGSAILTRMLSTQYTCTNWIPCFVMSSKMPCSCSARYRPPFPSVRHSCYVKTGTRNNIVCKKVHVFKVQTNNPLFRKL